MAKDLGKKVSYTYDNEDYSYDSVVFQKGKPPLDSEVNLSQQLLADLTRKSTRDNSSGWISYKEVFAEAGNNNLFYTQNPEQAEPEIALVNGWAVHVTNTKNSNSNVNVISMDEFPLVNGSRVDGVFLEVWRGLVSDEMSGITTPSDLTKIGVINGVHAINENVVWAVGDNGIILKTDNGGVTWLSQVTPTASTLRTVKFVSENIGYVGGSNGTLFKTEDAGSTWSKISTPTLDAINDICVIGDGTVVTAGDNGTVLRSTNGLDFGVILDTGNASSNLNSIYFYDSSVGWAVGDDGTYIRTLNGGTSWVSQSITTLDPSNTLQETTVAKNINGIRFVNLSDGWAVGDDGLILRTTDGGIRWSDISLSIYNPESESNNLVPAYSSTNKNLNAIEIRKSFPLRISLFVRNVNLFRSASYEINPTSLVLTYQDADDFEIHEVKLILSRYPKDTDLLEAINSIRDEDTGEFVFNAALSYTESSYQSHDNTGTIYGTQSTEIKFSMGDRAWIVGDDGLVLSTKNGGARWTEENSTTNFDLYGVSFSGLNYGWVAGDQGDIAKYDASVDSWEDQDTDLVKQTQRKVYYKGNNESPATLNLRNDSVHPEINTETSARTQIQYRIRVVEGVDINNFKDSGLGSSYTFSKGPNGTVREAGMYKFENMGTKTGDYGLWRALCRNTVDGYTYAIPMFMVSRKNQQPYNPSTNINGTSVDAIGAIRPDGLVYTDITNEDIVDVRRRTGNLDMAQYLSSSFDMLMDGTLRTSMISEPSRGGQIGSLLTHTNQFGSDQLSNLIGTNSNGVNSRAEGGIEAFAAGSQEQDGITFIPGISGPPDVAYFNTLANGMYNHDPSFFSATYSVEDGGPSDIDGTDIPGYFTGLGTPEASFVFGATGVSSEEGVNYVVRGAYIDYSSPGLDYLPEVPLQLKNTQGGTPSESVHFYGISEGIDSQVVRRLSTGISGNRDYVEVSSNYFGEEPEKVGSPFRLHIFQQIDESTNEVKILKNNEGYFVYSIKKIINKKDGGSYRVSAFKDRDGSDASTMVASLASTYTIPAGSVIEIIAEVTTLEEEDAVGRISIGQVTEDKGETVDAFRSPYLTLFSRTDKGVGKSYKSVIMGKSTSGGNVTFTEKIVGISTSDYLSGEDTTTVWSWDGSSATTVPVTNVTKDSDGYITSIFSPSITSGTVLVVALVEEEEFPNTDTDSGALVSYKHTAPQTLRPLPDDMEFEIVEGPTDFVISSLGAGGGLSSSMYDNTLEQIPVFDNLNNPSFFFNLYGLEMESFIEQGGYLTLPFRVSRKPGGVIKAYNSSVDRQGRTFYRNVDKEMVFKTEGMSLGNPRKLMVPFLVKLRSQVVNPAVRGEILLAVASSYENTTLENGIYLGKGISRSVLSFYKIPGMPVAK